MFAGIGIQLQCSAKFVNVRIISAEKDPSAVATTIDYLL
jgi:hypothetical protein